MSNVTFTLDAEEAAAVQAFLRLIDTQRKAERQFQRTSARMQHQDSLLNGMTARLGRWAAGFASAATAIDTARRALKFHNDEMDRASERARGSEFALAKLSQLAGGDANEMRRMVSEAKKTSMEAGIDLNRAADLQFNLESLGIADKRRLFARLVGTVDDPAALASAAVTTQNAFGKRETGSVRAILNKGLAASSVSKTTLNEMLLNVSKIAPGVQQIGGSDEEALAALAVLSKARKSPENAADEISSLTKVLIRRGLGGQGLMSGIQALKEKLSRLPSDAERQKFLGDDLAFKGFHTLTQPETAQQLQQALVLTQKANATGENDLVAGTIRVRREIPEIASAAALRRVEQSKAQQQADLFGAERNQQLTAVQAVELASLRRGESPITRMVRVMAADLAKLFGASPETIGDVATIADAVKDPGMGVKDAEQFKAEFTKILAEAVKQGVKEATKETPQVARNGPAVE